MLTKELIFEVIGMKTAMLTPAQVSQVLNIPIKTLYNMKSDNRLPFPILRVGSRWSVDVNSVIEYAAYGAVSALEKAPAFKLPTPKVKVSKRAEADREMGRQCGFY